MKIALFENLRKRIILVIIGIASYYLAPALLGILFNSLTHVELFTLFWLFYVYKGIALSCLVGFLYVAFVKVKPSMVPKQTKYRQMVIAGIIIITILSVLIPSGLILDDWKQGQCLIKSGVMNEKGIFVGMISSSVGYESECMQNCMLTFPINMREDKLCEFNGLFGFTHWVKMSKDFAYIEDNISGRR